MNYSSWNDNAGYFTIIAEGIIVDLRKILAQNLKNYRKKHNLSQEALAAKAHLSTRGYGKIERGEVSVISETLVKLSEATGLSIEYLLTEH